MEMEPPSRDVCGARIDLSQYYAVLGADEKFVEAFSALQQQKIKHSTGQSFPKGDHVRKAPVCPLGS